jgi:hypothetical protein
VAGEGFEEEPPSSGRRTPLDSYGLSSLLS